MQRLEVSGAVRWVVRRQTVNKAPCCDYLRRLRVFENKVLGRFGPKRDYVTREWRKLHDEELNDLYSSPTKYKREKKFGDR